MVPPNSKSIQTVLRDCLYLFPQDLPHEFHAGDDLFFTGIGEVQPQRIGHAAVGKEGVPRNVGYLAWATTCGMIFAVSICSGTVTQMKRPPWGWVQEEPWGIPAPAKRASGPGACGRGR